MKRPNYAEGIESFFYLDIALPDFVCIKKFFNTLLYTLYRVIRKEGENLMSKKHVKIGASIGYLISPILF